MPSHLLCWHGGGKSTFYKTFVLATAHLFCTHVQRISILKEFTMKKLAAKTAYKNHTESSKHKEYSDHTANTSNTDGKAKARESVEFSQATGARNVSNLPTRLSSNKANNDKPTKLALNVKTIDAASPVTTNDAQQRIPVSQTAASATRKPPFDLKITLRTIDKVMIDAPLSPEQIESAIDVCKQWVKGGCAIRITSQSERWQAVYVFYLGGSKNSDHTNNPSVTLHFQSRGHNSDVGFRLQLKPHHLDAQHVAALKKMWQKVFSFDWRDVRSAATIYRGDEALDFMGNLDSILFDRKASQVKDNYFIKTNRKGGIQTQYIGEATTASRGIVYDRELAELFRNHAGQPVPLNRKTATHVMEHDKNVDGLIRVESRRVFTPKLSYTEFMQTPSAFSEFNVFDLSRLRPRDRQDNGLMLYIEWVRLRGTHGAKHRLFEMQGKTAATKKLLAEYTSRLARTQCEWWQQLDRVQQLGVLLDTLLVNSFLKKIGIQRQ